MVDVSVVMPVYNVEKYIRASLDSVLAQTHQNIEIILVDDGSTDKSGEICEAYAKRDRRIQVIHKINEGSGSARNAGMDAAQGKYIYFCDPDDLFSPDLIEDTFSSAQKWDADIVLFGYRSVKIKENGDFGKPDGGNIPKVAGCFTREEIWSRHIELVTFMTSPWMRLFRLSMLRQFHLRFCNMSTGQDAVFVFDVYATPFCRLVSIPKAYYTYVRHEKSATMAFKPERMRNEFMIAGKFASLVASCAPGKYDDLVALFYVISASRGVKNMLCGQKIGIQDIRKTLQMYMERREVRDVFEKISLSMYHDKKTRLKVFLLKRKWYCCYTVLFYLSGKKDYMKGKISRLLISPIGG